MTAQQQGSSREAKAFRPWEEFAIVESCQARAHKPLFAAATKPPAPSIPG